MKKNMMSDLHQPPCGFLRYWSDRLDSNFEKEKSLREKDYVYTQNVHIDAGLARVERVPQMHSVHEKT